MTRAVRSSAIDRQEFEAGSASAAIVGHPDLGWAYGCACSSPSHKRWRRSTVVFIKGTPRLSGSNREGVLSIRWVTFSTKRPASIRPEPVNDPAVRDIVVVACCRADLSLNDSQIDMICAAAPYVMAMTRRPRAGAGLPRGTRQHPSIPRVTLVRDRLDCRRRIACALARRLDPSLCSSRSGEGGKRSS